MDVSRTLKIVGLRFRICDCADASSSLSRSDSGFGRDMIQRSQKSRLVGGIVQLDQRQQLKASSCLGKNGQAEVTTTAHHKVDRFRRCQLGSTNEIALVLSIFIIKNDYDFASANGFNGFFNTGKRTTHGFSGGAMTAAGSPPRQSIAKMVAQFKLRCRL